MSIKINKIELRPGDVFLSKGSNGLSQMITAVESWYAKDCYAEYSHSGIVLNNLGLIFEGGLINGKKNLFDKYYGKEILVGRHDQMRLYRYANGKQELDKFENTLFPIHRFLLLMFPPLARRIYFLQYGICSEFTSMFLYHAGLMDYWRGVMPSHITEMIRKWKGWNIVAEGTLYANA